MYKNFIVKNCLAFVILASAVLISYGVIAHAQDASSVPAANDDAVAHGITFPISELGNCASKDECKNYCNDPANMTACISFARAHGLMNKNEAATASKFQQNLAAGAGPGGCKTPTECQSFCSNSANLETCVNFAKQNGIKDSNVDQGEKILNYIKSGGQLPGGCTSKESCQQYCGDFSHAQECFQFAQKAGITQIPGGPGNQTGNGPQPGDIQKFLTAVQNGQTPGGCKSKDECETYCQDSSHREECLTFAQNAGLISPDQASNIRQSGGKGPGGCDSPESCQSYCNDSAHQDECLKFAQDNGFISSDQAQQAQQGLVRLREGLDNAPPEVQSCLQSTVGPNVISDIQSGKLTPGPEIGDSVKNCFEKFGTKGDPTQVFKNAPPEVISCLKEKLGDQFDQVASGKTAPTPEMGDAMRICFAESQLQGGNSNGAPGQGSIGKPTSQMLQNFLQSAPPEIQSCLQQNLGDDFSKIQSGQEVQFDQSKVQSCFQQFRPPMNGAPENGPAHDMKNPSGPATGMMNLNNLPQEIKQCLADSVGKDVLDKVQSGQLSANDLQQAMMDCEKQIQQPSGGLPPAGSPGIMPPPFGSPGAFPPPPNANFTPPPGFTPQQSGTMPQFSPNGLVPPSFPIGSAQPLPPPNNPSSLTPLSQAGCEESGGTWNGSSCVMPSANSPEAQCQNSGGVWDGTTCQIAPTGSFNTFFKYLFSSMLKILGQ